ncbi:primosomal protein N' [Patescibacteria group bacterium]
MKSKIISVIPATKVAPNREQVFSYLVSPDQKVSAGQLVRINFARRNIFGVALDAEPQTNTTFKLKQITDIVEKQPALTEIQLQLAKWIADYYMTSLGLVIKTMLPRRSVRPPKFVENKVARDKPHQLNDSQAKALEIILQAKKNTTLLHGVTGSGKTEVYLQAIAKMIATGKQSIVMIPEIALTPQTIDRFTKRFGPQKIALLHSRLSYGARYREWLRIRNEEAQIVIGPRSALFAPVQKLGLIVMDEEHETSYKQWDQHPRYHARRVARQYTKLADAKLILGSATPSVETFFAAEQGVINYVKLPDRIKQKKLPQVKIVDMRQELAAGNRSVFSEILQTSIEQALHKKEQVILFINRRGAATFVMCRDCGHVIECPNCSVSLTYHFQDRPLICHHCGHQEQSPRQCPSCQSTQIKFFGAGTQKIEIEAKKLFPEAQILRMDTDTTRLVLAHQKIFTKFANQQADILIGTQMVAKGFDLPNVTLVGIMSADTALNIPNFRAHEQTFQLLTQVAGRTGRDKKGGHVILQTYHPKHAVIQNAARHDYSSFYQAEILERKLLQNPPFIRLAKLTIKGRDNAKVKHEASKTSQELLRQFPKLKILGPAPAIIAKKQHQYIWHVLLQAKSHFPKNLPKLLGPNWTIDIDPLELL